METLAVKIIKEYFILLIKVLPYFLIGVTTGAILRHFNDKINLEKYLKRGFKSITYASLLGAILPGCSCATIPLASGLKSHKNISLGTVVSFIMVSPLLSPITIFLTYGLFGWKITVVRIIFSIIGGIILGLCMDFAEFKSIKGFSLPESTPSLQLIDNPCCKKNKNDCVCNPKITLLTHLKESFKEVTAYFLIGMGIAAFLTIIVPEDSISNYMGSSGIFAYLTAALIGIPLYVCEGEEIPIAYALLNKGLGVGPTFTFLLASVGTCIPTFVMAQKVIGKIPTLAYIIYWFLFAIGCGIVLQVLY